MSSYPDAAHILPILFSFTTPAKYCYRGIATFIRYVTGMLPPPGSDSLSNIPMTLSPPTSPGLLAVENFRLSPVPSRRSSFLQTRSATVSRDPSPRPRGASLFTIGNNKKQTDDSSTSGRLSRKQSFKQTLSAHVSRAGILFKGQGQPKLPDLLTTSASSSPPPERLQQQDPEQASPTSPTAPPQENSVDVAGPRFYGSGYKEGDDDTRRAGEAAVYKNGLVSPLFNFWASWL